MDVHLQNKISEYVELIAACAKGSSRVISTEEAIARIYVLNEQIGKGDGAGANYEGAKPFV